jgi:hypothetical protein
MTGAAFEIIAVVVVHLFDEHRAHGTRLGICGFHIFAQCLFILIFILNSNSGLQPLLKLCARRTKVLPSVTMRACLLRTGWTRENLLEIAGWVHSDAVGCWTISIKSWIEADVMRERCMKQLLDQ